jgi:hypothetical protein
MPERAGFERNPPASSLLEITRIAEEDGGRDAERSWWKPGAYAPREPIRQTIAGPGLRTVRVRAQWVPPAGDAGPMERTLLGRSVWERRRAAVLQHLSECTACCLGCCTPPVWPQMRRERQANTKTSRPRRAANAVQRAYFAWVESTIRTYSDVPKRIKSRFNRFLRCSPSGNYRRKALLDSRMVRNGESVSVLSSSGSLESQLLISGQITFPELQRLEMWFGDGTFIERDVTKSIGKPSLVPRHLCH